VLQQAFEDGASASGPALALAPFKLALPGPDDLAQVLQSIAGHEIPVANLSDPTSETALVYLLTIIDDGTVREEFPHWAKFQLLRLAHIAPSHRCYYVTALDNLRHRIAAPLPSLVAATSSSSATDHTDPST
jgi:hypothetical protein